MYKEDDYKNYKYVIYARRSIEKSDEEQVNSTADQVKVMTKVATEKKLKIVKVFTETHSASKPNKRPVFNEMIKYIESRKANAILTWNFDRLSRNPLETGMIHQMIADTDIKAIRFPDGKFYDQETNDVVTAVDGAMASEYIKRHKKNVWRGLQGAVSRGYRPSFAPLGYRNSKYREKGMQEEIKIEPHESKIIQKIFYTILERQYTPSQVRDIAYKQWGLRTRKSKKFPNGKELTYSGWYKMLCNPFYYGRFEYPVGSGEWYDGNHEALITREEFEEVQKILGKDNARPKTHSFAYTGLMRCSGCGARITCEEKTKRPKNGKVHIYRYYRCTGMIDRDCIQKSVREDVLEEQYMEFLSSIQISPSLHQWAMSELEKEYGREQTDKESISHTQEKASKDVEKRLSNLFEMRLSGDITSEEYQERKRILEEEQSLIKSQLESENAKVQSWIHDARRLMKFCERAKYEFLNGSHDKRRQIIAAIGTEHILKDRVVQMEVEKPFLVIQEMVSPVNYPLEILEPPKDVALQGYNPTFLPFGELMWTLPDSNR